MSKKIKLIFIVILAILIVIGLSFAFKGNNINLILNKDKVREMYQKMSEEKNFIFSMEEQGDDFKYKVVMAQKGANISIDSSTEEDHTTTLILDKDVFYIDHTNEEYYYDTEYGVEDIDTDIILSSLNAITQNEYVSGKEEIDGVSYDYQEYLDEDANFVIYADYNEDSSVKTRFYFENNEIKYIKNIIEFEEDKQEELIKVDLSYQVDDSTFEIPSDYAEVEY